MVASQKRLVTQAKPNKSQVLGDLALFNEDGSPFTPGSGGSAAQATTDTPGTVKQGVAVADATGDTPTKAEFNALLASLRTAGIIAS